MKTKRKPLPGFNRPRGLGTGLKSETELGDVVTCDGADISDM
jgi:hypothetical protein